MLSQARRGSVANSLFDQTIWSISLNRPFSSMQSRCFRKNTYWKFLPRQNWFFLEQVYRKMFFVVVVSPLLNLMRILLKNSFLHHYFGIRRDGFCSRDMLLSVLLLTLSSLPSLLQNMLHSASKDAPIPATSTTPSSSVPKQKHAGM